MRSNAEMANRPPS